MPKFVRNPVNKLVSDFVNLNVGDFYWSMQGIRGLFAACTAFQGAIIATVPNRPAVEVVKN